MENLLAMMLLGSPEKDMIQIAGKKEATTSFVEFAKACEYDLKKEADRKAALEAYKEIRATVK